jgi:hypothetical protein
MIIFLAVWSPSLIYCYNILRFIAIKHIITVAMKLGMPMPKPTPKAILSEVLSPVPPRPPKPPATVEAASVSVD